MDMRVFALSPAGWEILRHLDTAERLPIKLLTKVSGGDLNDIVSLFWWQMLDGWWMHDVVHRFDLEWHGNDRPLARGPGTVHYSREEFKAALAVSDTCLWAEIASMGRWAEKRIAPCRRALAALRHVDDLPWNDLLRKVEGDPEPLFGLDDAGMIQALTPPRLRKRARATSDEGRYAHAPGEARGWIRAGRPDRATDVLVQITPKGRRYGVARDGALV